MSQSIPDNHLVQGPVNPQWASQASSALPKDYGAAASFLGIIRRDASDQKGTVVEAIDYSAYGPMAEAIFRKIEEQILRQYDIGICWIRHSVGLVKAGEASMLVLVASTHRAAAFDALQAAVETVKAEAPVWKRELLNDGSHRWVDAL